MNSSNYYLQIISLDNCSYSKAATELVKNFKISNEIINVNQNNKQNFKTNIINTFPQVYLKKYNKKGSLLLGGYTDLESTINNFKSVKYNNEKINNFMNKYKWSKKATLRLIQLINS